MKKLLLLSALLIFACSFGQKIKLSKLDTTKFKVVQYNYITPIEYVQITDTLEPVEFVEMKFDTTKFKVVQYKHITPIEFQPSEIKLDTILNNNKK